MSDKPKTSFADGNQFFILGEFDKSINEEIVLPLTKKIKELEKQRDAEIEIIINSNGGDSGICMHLVDLIEIAKRKDIMVKTVVRHYAFSAGSMLAAAGSPDHRYIAPAAEHLIHYGTINGWSNHTPTQLERESKFFQRWFKSIAAHYRKYANVPDLEKHIKDDNFFIDAKTAIRWKLADKLTYKLWELG